MKRISQAKQRSGVERMECNGIGWNETKGSEALEMGFALSGYRFLFKTDTCYITLHFALGIAGHLRSKAKLVRKARPEGTHNRNFKKKYSSIS